MLLFSLLFAGSQPVPAKVSVPPKPVQAVRSARRAELGRVVRSLPQTPASVRKAAGPQGL